MTYLVRDLHGAAVTTGCLTCLACRDESRGARLALEHNM